MTAQPINVRDMAIIHRTFRKAYDESARLVRTARAAPPERVTFLADHIDFAIAALHIHHEGEDELLYPKLIERVPDQAPMTKDAGAQRSLAPHGVLPDSVWRGRCWAISVVPCPAAGLG